MREKGILNQLHKDCIIEKEYIEKNPRSNPTTFIHKFIFLRLLVMRLIKKKYRPLFANCYDLQV
jgi:hypothetical protein